MPYKVKGKAVYRKDTGKLVGHSKNPKKYLRTLNAIEHNPKFAAKLRRRRIPSKEFSQ